MIKKCRYFCLNIFSYYDSSLPLFVEFNDFDSYLEKFGSDVRSNVLVWRLDDSLHLVARPTLWTTNLVEYWTKRLLCVLDSEV